MKKTKAQKAAEREARARAYDAAYAAATGTPEERAAAAEAAIASLIPAPKVDPEFSARLRAIQEMHADLDRQEREEAAARGQTLKQYRAEQHRTAVAAGAVGADQDSEDIMQEIV